MILKYVLLLAWTVVLYYAVSDAFQPRVVSVLQHHRRRRRASADEERARLPPMGSSSPPYGRGAEIWPPANEEPVRLQDSFPNGEIPEEAVGTMKNIGSGAERKPVRWRRLLPRAIDRVLRRAAGAEEEQEASIGVTDSTPAVLALALASTGTIRPLDFLLVTFLSGYFTILNLIARSTRKDDVTPILPALPPQGHVPTLVSNPLGYELTYSLQYDRWLAVGALLGLLCPVLAALKYALDGSRAAVSATARPVFLLCCQAVSESAGRRAVTPLPLRILIPTAYSTVRLGYLWHWSFSTAPLGRAGRFLAVANLIYWGVNLFGFLLPVAAIRYMRAHFLCVEAEQVTIRAGMEESMGLSSF